MRRHRGNGEIRLRGTTWWIRYYVNGRRVEESSHSKREGDAARLLRNRLGDVAKGIPVAVDAKKVTFEDLASMVLAEYAVQERRSLPRLKTALNHLRAYFATWRAVAIDYASLNQYVQHRIGDKAARASIRMELVALRVAFKLAQKAGRLIYVPAFPSLGPLNNTRTGFFERGELDAVTAELPEELRPVVLFAYLTGWRKSEILGLEWRNVDWHAGEVRLDPGTTKNREGRAFPFAILPELQTLMGRQRAYTDTTERKAGSIIPAVFHRGGRAIRDFYAAWRAACLRSGLKGRILHDFRRTAVRNMERAGVSRSVAKALSGHKTDAIYNRYAITSTADLREGVAKLAALHQDATRKVLPLRTGTERGQSGV